MSTTVAGFASAQTQPPGAREIAWDDVVTRAIAIAGTPCHVAAWAPIEAALRRLRALDSAVPIESWLSFKTQPLPQLAERWIASGRGVEVVSECELTSAMRAGCPIDRLLVNGVAKHAWLAQYGIRGLRVHFDSLREIDRLLPSALEYGWRVGVRCHVPDERDARDPQFAGQFGLSREEAIAAIRRLRDAGADLQSVHFHLGQARQDGGAYRRALDHVASVCDDAAFDPWFVDCGGGLPAADDPAIDAALYDLASAVRIAPSRFRALRAIWLENGRFITQTSAVLAVRVVDSKERGDSRYLICDGGRTNHALAADTHRHDLMVIPERRGTPRLTTVCGPTCMTDDRLGRWPLPDDVAVGDVLVWLDAGAYHLPWETRFSHGLCPVVWCDETGALVAARAKERPDEWAARWRSTAEARDA